MAALAILKHTFNTTAWPNTVLFPDDSCVSE